MNDRTKRNQRNFYLWLYPWLLSIEYANTHTKKAKENKHLTMYRNSLVCVWISYTKNWSPFLLRLAFHLFFLKRNISPLLTIFMLLQHTLTRLLAIINMIRIKREWKCIKYLRVQHTRMSVCILMMSHHI